MKRRRIQRIELNLDELKQIIERAGVSDEDRGKLLGAVETLAWVTSELDAHGHEDPRKNEPRSGPVERK